ncbi:MAG: MFS transporter [Candidatus Poseidoniales archaeon]|jgi:MFS family permease|tara:strand:+ start:281 stop:1546 length:1266 start_codon:yes stop_codon:yes gene_type:complete
MSDVGYVQILRNNHSFRRLFIAQELSYIGDWFTVITLFILAGEASDNSPLAIAGVLATRSFSLAAVTPFTGMLADRYSRKGLMITSDLAACIVLGIVLQFNLLNSLSSVYFLAVAMVVAKSIFDPAQYAYLPNICTDEELLTANALGSGGWSIALGIGASIGGLTIANYGITTALWIDALTFLISAIFIMTLPSGGPDISERENVTLRIVNKEITDGWRYILQNSEIRRLVIAKALWSSGGGAQIFLLILIGMEAGFGDIAAGIGILFMARGFGSGFGPMVGRPLMKNKILRPYLIGLAVGTSGIFYIIISIMEWSNLLLVMIFIAHAASGFNWVQSTTLTQERAGDEWRGRVAGADFLALTFMMGTSAIAAGFILENQLLELREVIALSAIIQIIMGIGWILIAAPKEKVIFDKEPIVNL